MNTIDISKMNKAKVLKALYDNSKQQGMGLLQPKKELTIEHAKELLKEYNYFDYLYGTVLKIDFSENELCLRLYDRDNGAGAGLNAINSLNKQQPDSEGTL